MARMRTLVEEFTQLGLYKKGEKPLVESDQEAELLGDDEFEDEDVSEDEDVDEGELEEAKRAKLRSAKGGKKVVMRKTGAELAAQARDPGYKKQLRMKRRKSKTATAVRARKKAQARFERRFGRDAASEDPRQSAPQGQGEDRLDVLISELHSLNAKYSAAANMAEEANKDVALAQRIYANIARVADAVSQRLDENDELFPVFDALANDALTVAESIQSGKVKDMDAVIDAVPGYVRDLIEALGPVSEELDAELAELQGAAPAEESDEDDSQDPKAPW